MSGCTGEMMSEIEEKLPGWITEAIDLGVDLPARLTEPMDRDNFIRAVWNARYKLIQQVPQARNDLKAGRIWLALITRDEILDYRHSRDSQIALRQKTSMGKSYVVESVEPIPAWEAA